jgi:RNase P/RNase MRP subunit p29
MWKSKGWDVSRYSDLIGRTVRVAISDGREKDGVLYCVDPETRDVILILAKDRKAIAIHGHAVRHVRVLDKEIRITVDAMIKEKKETGNEKQQTLDILKRNRIPVQENKDGHLSAFEGALTIKPPYRAEDCIGSNEIILRRVQDLLLLQ